MKKALNQLFLKHVNIRNLYFSIALLAIAALFLGVSFTEDFKVDEILDVIWILVMFFYVWMLAIYGGEIGTGFLARQISNGLTRREAFLQMLVFSIFFSFIYYVAILLILLCFTIAHSEITEYVNQFIGLPFLSFICLGQVTLLISLMVKNALNGVLLGFFVFLQFEPIPARFLSKYIDPHFMLISPHYLAKELVIGNSQVDILFQVAVILMFTVLFSSLSYIRIKKMDFI
jgi:hypothetical protein